MGIYVNPDNIDFHRAVADDIYIDKTNLIEYTNDRISKARRYLCVSRPRRFGKSMAADMLVAYYSKGCDSSKLFAGTKIAKKQDFQLHLNRHAAIWLDVQQFLFDEAHLDIFIEQMQEAVIEELRAEYGGLFVMNPYGLPGALKQIYAQTKQGFVFIIDEWDCVFRFAKERTDIQKKYLDFLRGLFKGSAYVELTYMTGILPIKKYGEHSALNIFEEFSMTDPANLSDYFGFTEEEVAGLCIQHQIELHEIRKWYDGYLLDEIHIYNPKSVVDVMRRGKFKGYWTGTETYEALKHYIEMNYGGLKEAIVMMLGNQHYKINTRKFQNDMTTFKSKDDILTLLIHLGYLSFDEKSSEAFIPNQEIAGEFLDVVDAPGWGGLIQALNRSQELLKRT